VGALLA